MPPKFDFTVQVSKQTYKANSILNFKRHSYDDIDESMRTLECHESQLDLLKSYWHLFYEANERLIVYYGTNETHSYFKDGIFASVEREYSNARSFILRQIKGCEIFNQSNVVRNQSQGSEKLQHLVNSLEGMAKQSMKGITITAANFNVAWENCCVGMIISKIDQILTYVPC